MPAPNLTAFAARYTAAWCSHAPTRVAAYFTERGSLTINDGTPAVGRPAIAAAVQAFMTAFPDMIVIMEEVSLEWGLATYRWTLMGTNTGPSGTGRFVRISGYEQWRFGAEGLIEDSQGHFDAAEYERQLRHGAPGNP